MSSLIYLITNTLNNKKYVGWTNKSALDRWKVHIQCANRGQKSHLYNAIRLYGKDVFTIEELEYGDDNKYMLNIREPYYISLYNKDELYNMTIGGEGGVTSGSWKPGHISTNKGKKFPIISKKRKEYWELWKQENPNYKDQWKKYEKIGVSEESREYYKTTTISRNKIKAICPYCDKEGQMVNMKRWHFEKCRYKNSKSE